MAPFSFGRRVQRLQSYARFIITLASFFVLTPTFFGCAKNEAAGQENRLEAEDMNIFVKYYKNIPMAFWQIEMVT
jgi:hypothetical protein